MRRWEGDPKNKLPTYGVYHVMLDAGWGSLARRQINNLHKNDLLDVTTTFFVSRIAVHQGDVDCLEHIISSDKLVIISNVTNPKRYKYPALEFIKQLSEKKDCFFYYFHTEGISHQSLTPSNRLFCSFEQKIEVRRGVLEHFISDKWKVAVNALSEGYDTYSYYRWPPRNYIMYSGSFWWAKSAHMRTLPDFDKAVISADRFYSEVWLLEQSHRQLSAFDTITDLYFVEIPRSIYTDKQTR